MRQNTGKPNARRKRDRLVVASFVDDAAGEGFPGEVRLGAGIAAEQLSQDQCSDQYSASGSGSASDGYLSAEDAYAEEDWGELQQAEAGAAGADAQSEGSLSGQMPDGTLGMLQDAGADQREAIMHQAGMQGRPEQAAFDRPEGSANACGKTPALVDRPCGGLL